MRVFIVFLCSLLPCEALSAGLAKSAAGPLRAAYGHSRVVVDGDIARTVITQVFVNELPHEVEAAYSYPLPDDAAVTGFSEWRDGRRVVAVTRGKDEAKKAYDTAVERGERAAHGETSPGRRFTMTLSSIPSRGARRVELQYIQTLSGLGSARRLVLPAGGKGPVASMNDVEVTLRGRRALLDVTVPNHPGATVVGAGSERIIRLSQGRRAARGDVVVQWTRDSDAVELAARATRPDPAAAAFIEARFAFNTDPNPGVAPPRDVVVLVDHSLSMAGEPLEKARTAVATIVNALGPRDRLEIIGVATELTPFFGTLTPPTSALVEVAHEMMADVRATGRTALAPALEMAGTLLRKSENGVLVLLTDGQPTLGGHAGPFSLAVDAAAFANSRVILAQFNYPKRGEVFGSLFPNLATRYVPNGAAGDTVVDEVARLAMAPVIENVTMEIFGDGVHDVHGAVPHRVAVGEHIRLLGRIDQDATVVVQGELYGETVSLEMEVDAKVGGDDLGLPVEWARMRVRHLERDHSRAPDVVEREVLESEIRHLGHQYNLATKFTGYVMTDSLAPDLIKPGDPEIRIHAPVSATSVFGILPWGEVIDCVWDDEEGLWFGRFLVPRATPDGVYRVRIFVQTQGETRYRGPLFFTVDSDIPAFDLIREDGDGPLSRGEWMTVSAVPAGRMPTFGKGGDRLDPDPLYIKSVEVLLGGTLYTLTRAGEDEVWTGKMMVDLPPGVHRVELVAKDYARNSTTDSLEIEVK